MRASQIVRCFENGKGEVEPIDKHKKWICELQKMGSKKSGFGFKECIYERIEEVPHGWPIDVGELEDEEFYCAFHTHSKLELTTLEIKLIVKTLYPKLRGERGTGNPLGGGGESCPTGWCK